MVTFHPLYLSGCLDTNAKTLQKTPITCVGFRQSKNMVMEESKLNRCRTDAGIRMRPDAKVAAGKEESDYPPTPADARGSAPGKRGTTTTTTTSTST